MPSRKKNGRFLENVRQRLTKNRLDIISTPVLSTTDFDTPSTLDFDTFFTPDFDTSFHQVLSNMITNDLYFSGKLKPIGYTRHVIDIGTFFENMKCTKCDITLKFKDGIGISPAGLCGHLIVRCFNCNDCVRVAMGKIHKSHHGPKIFDVNTKLTTGTLQTDNGDSDVVHAIASGSKTATALSGIPSTDDTNSVCDPVNVTGITASADGAFQRRGSGRCYNSLSAQNNGESDRIKNNLPSVVLHQFGKHDECGDWCQMKNNPTAKHRNLPWGADLKDENLKKRSSKGVHEELGLNPGIATTVTAAIRDKDVNRKRTALQRLKLKSKRSSETRSHEIWEGDTYCSNVIGRQSSITQISAVIEELEFNRYATPTQEISEDASRVTGIRFNTATNELLYNDEPVSHKHPQQVLLDFLQFLMSLCASDKHIVLATHNNRRFDSIILFNQLKFYKLWNHFSRYIVGFCDTLPFFKMLYPEFENYKQEYIAQKLLKEAYSAHNVLDDCRMLTSLVKKTEKVDVLISDYFYSTHQVTVQGVQPNLESLER
ncbi:unnamed protein product [Mytilus coruscus]|uniref:Exuperantia RNAse H-like domain-containing protein n=1 Tax=Mytilus coruscus TaxID=42192 RepID=A0A6J8ANW4_MYTCO|nr:unnamed protein product [Mytilus coruscus]